MARIRFAVLRGERMSAARKRFIAGAVCPVCHAEDTIAVWLEERQEVAQCVVCGHRMSPKETEVPSDKGPIIGLFKQ